MKDKLMEFIHKYKVKAELYDTIGSVKTVAESAALGVLPEKIIKSLLFLWKKPVLVLVRGDCRADESVLSKLFQGIRFANANEVRQTTGYGPGDIPPLLEGEYIRIMDKRVAIEGIFECGGGRNKRHLRISAAELRRVQIWTITDIAQRHSD